MPTGADNGLGGASGNAFYHDNWWIWDAERGIYAAVGMNGQSLFLHRPSRTVIAKLSTFPDVLDTRLFALHHAGMAALARVARLSPAESGNVHLARPGQ